MTKKFFIQYTLLSILCQMISCTQTEHSSEETSATTAPVFRHTTDIPATEQKEQAKVKEENPVTSVSSETESTTSKQKEEESSLHQIHEPVSEVIEESYFHVPNIKSVLTYKRTLLSTYITNEELVFKPLNARKSYSPLHISKAFMIMPIERLEFERKIEDFCKNLVYHLTSINEAKKEFNIGAIKTTIFNQKCRYMRNGWFFFNINVDRLPINEFEETQEITKRVKFPETCTLQEDTKTSLYQKFDIVEDYPNSLDRKEIMQVEKVLNYLLYKIITKSDCSTKCYTDNLWTLKTSLERIMQEQTNKKEPVELNKPEEASVLTTEEEFEMVPATVETTAQHSHFILLQYICNLTDEFYEMHIDDQRKDTCARHLFLRFVKIAMIVYEAIFEQKDPETVEYKKPVKTKNSEYWKKLQQRLEKEHVEFMKIRREMHRFIYYEYNKKYTVEEIEELRKFEIASAVLETIESLMNVVCNFRNIIKGSTVEIYRLNNEIVEQDEVEFNDPVHQKTRFEWFLASKEPTPAGVTAVNGTETELILDVLVSYTKLAYLPVNFMKNQMFEIEKVDDDFLELVEKQTKIKLNGELRRKQVVNFVKKALPNLSFFLNLKDEVTIGSLSWIETYTIAVVRFRTRLEWMRKTSPDDFDLELRAERN